MPVQVGSECELEPYGPTHPEHGSAGPGFDEYFHIEARSEPGALGGVTRARRALST